MSQRTVTPHSRIERICLFFASALGSTSAGRRRRRDRIGRIGPVQSRQVMQRDTPAPAVGGRPYQQRHQHNHDRQAQHRMRTHHSEIDQDDNRANWQSIADDGEGPRITGIRTKTKPQIEQRSRWDHPENSLPSPQCGQRLRSPRRSAVLTNFEREGALAIVFHACSFDHCPYLD